MNENSKRCYICSQAADNFDEKSQVYSIQCPRCGTYTISRETAVFISQHMSSSHLVSGYIRDANKRDDSPDITPQLLDEIKSDPTIPKTIIEQIDRLIDYLGRSSSYIRERVPYDCSKDYPIIYAKRASELDSIVDHLVKTAILEKPENKYLVLTIDGIRKFQEMATRRVDSTQAFVAMSFKPELIRDV